jgi:hypothetical protein
MSSHKAQRQLDTVFVSGCDHSFGLFYRERNGLLTNNMFTVLRREDRDFSVHAGGDTDGDDVDVVANNGVAIIRKPTAQTALCRQELRALVVDIDDADDFGFSQILPTIRVDGAQRAATDDTDAKFTVSHELFYLLRVVIGTGFHQGAIHV